MGTAPKGRLDSRRLAWVAITWFDNDDNSETDLGGSILGGIMLTPKFFLEAKLGLGDVPDWKFYVGGHLR